MEVGERAKVNYSVNRDAVLTFSIDDTSVATIEESANGVYVLGSKEGVTRIKVVAQLGDMYCSASARVVVVASENSDNPTAPEEPTDPTPPQGGEDGDDEGDPNPTPDPEENLTMSVSFQDTINCTVENGTLICSVDKTATVSVSVSVDAVSVSLVSNNALMNVVKNDLAGKSVYKISATEVGEYALTITAEGADGNIYTCNYNVIFQ